MSIIVRVEIFLVFGLVMFTLISDDVDSARQGQIRMIIFILYLSTFI